MKLKGLTDEMVDQLIPDGTILLGYRGSVAHGTYTPSYGPNARDDKDLLGVAIGPSSSYFGLEKFDQHIKEIEADDHVIWDVVVYELRKYVRLMLKANPNVLSLLFLPEHLYVTRHWLGQKLIDERDIFCSREAYHSFVGYAHGQLHRMTHPSGKHMGKKRRDLVLKFGYDTKNASHLVRILRVGIEFLSTGEIRVPREDAAELIEIKKGEWPLEKVERLADELFALAHEALIHSPLPVHPDRQRADLLCQEILTEWFECST